MAKFRHSAVIFWLDVVITISVELLISYTIYYLLIQRGYVYTFRIPVGTEYLSFRYILLLNSVLFAALTLGIFKERDNGQVQTVPQYFLSFIKHPITLGSIILLLFTLIFM